MARILIVFAHPEIKSFNGSLLRFAVRALEQHGHTVETSELFQMGFNPVSGPHDFDHPVDKEYFSYSEEQKRAVSQTSFAPDVAVEQDKVSRADVVIFHFPLWWFSMPGIMKGWVDRVFAHGYAYGGGRWFDDGPFAGKRAMLIVSTGGARAAYGEHGLQGDIDQILWPIHHGILRFTGFDVLPPFVIYGDEVGEPEKVEARLAARLARLLMEGPLQFPSVHDYDDQLRRKGTGV
ncbi:MAG: NAD(P)H-dependent oxidoreductase [Armatimonadetes bacterium]|nr:NAD(P)H-dependent oxidoreductase [Armatimonadota bacterium]